MEKVKMGRVIDNPLGVPLDGKQEAGGGRLRLDGLDGPVGRPRHDPQAPAQPVHGLVVGGIDPDVAGTDDGGQPGTGQDGDIMPLFGHSEPPVFDAATEIGQMGNQVAAADHVPFLAAEADAEDGHFRPGEGGSPEGQIPGLALGMHGFVLRRRFAGTGEVRPAGEQQAVERTANLRHPVHFLVRRDQHRLAARRTDRREVELVADELSFLAVVEADIGGEADAGAGHLLPPTARRLMSSSLFMTGKWSKAAPFTPKLSCSSP